MGTTGDTILRAGAVLEAYGEIYVSGGAATQVTNAVGGTFDVITGFTTIGASMNTTPALGPDQITLDEAGDYKVSFAASFSGTNSATITCRAYLDGVAQPQCSLTRKLGTGGDVGSASFQGIITATAGQVLDVRVTAAGNSKDFIPAEMSLSAVRV